MINVYQKWIKGNSDMYLRGFTDSNDAIRHIARCYKIDKDLNQLGAFYYFMKEV